MNHGMLKNYIPKCKKSKRAFARRAVGGFPAPDEDRPKITKRGVKIMSNYGRQDYDERRQARIERLQAGAEAAKTEAAAHYQAGADMFGAIPFGQPVHGNADRNYRERAAAKMEAGMKADERAGRLEARAEAAAKNTAISSDDPNSIEKLREKIEHLRKAQAQAKAMNAYFKKHGTMKGFEGCGIHLSDEAAEKIDENTRSNWNLEHRPFPSYELTSLNQRIKAAEARIAQIERTAAMSDEVMEFNGFTIGCDSEENRVYFDFDEKPVQSIIDVLKSYGFRYAYSSGRWQRLRTPQAWQTVKRLASEFDKKLQGEV